MKRPHAKTVEKHRVTLSARVAERLAAMIGEVAAARGQSISETAGDLLRFAMLPTIAAEIAEDMSRPAADRLETIRAIQKQYAQFATEVAVNVRTLGSLIDSMGNLETLILEEIEETAKRAELAARN